MADVLAIGAHPDDVELTMGGLLLRLKDAGRSIAILDLTRGEGGTRGTPETRAEEAAKAAAMLGAERTILDFGDGKLEPTMEVRRAVVDAIRRHRPGLVVAPHWKDLHPDHSAAGAAVRDVRYTCGMVNWFPGDHEAWKPSTFLFSMHHTEFPDSLVVDITDTWERKVELAECFGSQLHKPDSDEPATNIASKDFIPTLEARARVQGKKIGVRFGEPYFVDGPVPIVDPTTLPGLSDR
ncbi:MAG: bacillithiol biosynthesis deacetylase BshB1 [Planctomycetota bacterium]|jgi:bacillithiol biosynthesis deacetylase BshB1